jgi:hypothetical protein
LRRDPEGEDWIHGGKTKEERRVATRQDVRLPNVERDADAVKTAEPQAASLGQFADVQEVMG